jgi:hypothetical protein
MLRPALYLTLQPFPTLLDDSGCPYTPGRRLRGEQAITADGIAAIRIARAWPGTQAFTGYFKHLKRCPNHLKLQHDLSHYNYLK